MQYGPSPSQNVTARSFGDEIVAANFLRGVYYSMLGPAAQIWEGLMAGVPLDRVIAEVGSLSDADPQEFGAAAQAFVDGLVEERLIVPGERIPDEAWKPANPADGRYGLPILERYTDMEDLLRLDPVHEVDDMGWPNADPAHAAGAATERTA